MNMKSFAMLIVSGLLAASIAYIAPAIADDSTMDGIQMSADNTMQNNGSTNDSNMNNNTSGDHSNPSNADANSSDQGTPDTATGDDDY